MGNSIRGTAGIYNYPYDYEWFNMDTGFLKLLSRLEINNTTFDDVLDNGLADMTNGLGLVTIIGQHLKFYNQKFNNKPKPYGNDDVEREGTSRTQIGESGGNIPPVGPNVGGGVSGSEDTGKGLVKDGLGKVSGKEITVTQEGVSKVETYLNEQGFIQDYENKAMLDRLKTSLQNGDKITGADAVYYLHEIKEAELVRTGIPQPDAHQMSLDFYEVSPYSTYHPDVIKVEHGWWNNGWFDFWGIEK